MEDRQHREQKQGLGSKDIWEQGTRIGHRGVGRADTEQHWKKVTGLMTEQKGEARSQETRRMRT